jgi:hypothetical protein
MTKTLLTLLAIAMMLFGGITFANADENLATLTEDQALQLTQICEGKSFLAVNNYETRWSNDMPSITFGVSPSREKPYHFPSMTIQAVVEILTWDEHSAALEQDALFDHHHTYGIANDSADLKESMSTAMSQLHMRTPDNYRVHEYTWLIQDSSVLTNLPVLTRRTDEYSGYQEDSGYTWKHDPTGAVRLGDVLVYVTKSQLHGTGRISQGRQSIEVWAADYNARETSDVDYSAPDTYRFYRVWQGAYEIPTTVAAVNGE